jgi:hypothetical protein
MSSDAIVGCDETDAPGIRRRPATPPTKPRGELAVPVETFKQRRFAKRQILS